MKAFDEGRASWMDFYLIERQLGDGSLQDRQAVMFVDIGGGMGHEAIAVHKRFLICLDGLCYKISLQ